MRRSQLVESDRVNLIIRPAIPVQERTGTQKLVSLFYFRLPFASFDLACPFCMKFQPKDDNVTSP
jgi:hypothetical protein